MSAYSAGTQPSTGRYSDDFDSDEDRRSSTPRRDKLYYDRLRGRGRGAPLRGRGRGQRGQGRSTLRGRGHSRNSEPADMRGGRVLDNVAGRVMSASRNKINELRNRCEELKLKLRDLEQENKLYKKLQYRQERAIRQFEDKENDLPNILDKHNNEVRSLKEQNRRLREKHEKTDRYLRDAEDELERVKKKMVKYKKMCDEKELPEREELARKVTKAELDMEEKDVKIKELERHIESLKKNHRHELGIEAARQRELKKQLEEAMDKTSALQTTVKEKDKALEYSNIYSNPGRNRSLTRDSSPNESPGRSRARHNKSKASSLTDLTPRDKAKFYAEKRRAELLKQKEAKAEQEKKKRQKWEEEEREREAREREEREAREEREREEREKKEKEEAAAKAASPPHFNFRSIDRGLEDREEEERRKREEEQRRKREREDREAKEELDRKRIELEKRRDQEHRDRREREERERKEKEERERREREERDRREREREEQERRAKLEKERLDNDPALIEERRKKDELLRKLQAMDKLGSAGTTNESAPPASNTPGSLSPSRRSKESSRMGGGDGFDSASKRSDPKEYSFTNSVNNLHKGRPSHDDVTVPYIDRQRQQGRKPMTLASNQDQDDSFGYQPSFGPPGGVRGGAKGSSKPLSIFDNDDDDVGAFKVTTSSSKQSGAKKSTNLLENLFGPQAATGSNKNTSARGAEDNKTFFVTSQASPSPDTVPPARRGNMNNGNTTTFPWDTNTSSKPTANRSVFNTANQDNSSTLFGGGAALIEDNFTSANGKVLPRRRQQANLSTFSSKPSVVAMDNFEDDIEEVVL